MSGLLSKAKKLRNSILRRNANTINESVAQKLRAEEEEEIAHEMDAILEKSRIKINDETLSYHAQSSGSRLPLLINLAALTLVGGGIYFSALYFNQSEERIISGDSQMSSTEGRIISTIREESEAALAAKEAQLSSVRSQLNNLESELREKLDAELAAERERLLSSGATREQIESDLEAFERQRLAELNAEYQELQARLESERERLTAEVAAVAESAENEVVARLEELSRQRDEERLLGDQILSYYDRVNEELGKSEYAEALATLDQLEGFLARPAISGNPLMSERIDTERFLIESLRSLIDAETALDEDPADGADPNAELLARVGLLVEQGNERFAAGEYAESVERYRTALGLLDTNAQQVDRLVENLLQSGARLRAEPAADPNAELVSRIEALRTEYISSNGEPDGGADQAAVVTLLNAKVLMRQALALPEVQAQFPGLYTETGKVFEAYGEEERSMGRAEALEFVARMLASLKDDSAEESRPAEEAILDDFRPDEREALDRFLENLESLLTE